MKDYLEIQCRELHGFKLHGRKLQTCTLHRKLVRR